MPKLDKTLVTALLRTDRRYRGNVRTLAQATGIPYGTLRNAIGAGDQMRYERVTLVADALGVDESRIIQATGIPDKPPEQPKGPKGPPRRRKQKDDEEKPTERGPKRDNDSMRVAS